MDTAAALDSPMQQNDGQSQETLDGILKAHTERINDVSRKGSKLFQMYINQVKFSYWLTILVFLVLCSGGISLAIVSIILVLQSNPTTFHKLYSIGLLIASVLIVLILAFRNPIRSVRKPMTDTIKINILFTGFIYQIHQIDTEFRRTLQSGITKNGNDLELYSKQVQKAVSQTLESFTTSFDDLEE